MRTLHSDAPLAQAERLCRDYAALASQIRDLTRRAEGGDWLACDRAWDEFVRALESHFAFAEDEIFPRYLASGTGSVALVLQARAAHNEIRRELFQLGVELQLHLVQPRALRSVLEGVRERTGAEVRELCDWAEAQPESGLRSFLNRASEIVRRAA